MDPHAPFLILVIASTLFDATVAGGSLLIARARSRREGRAYLHLGGALWAAGVTGVLMIPKCVLLSRAGVHNFGLIHLIYIDLTVLLPLVGIAMLAASSLPGNGRRFCAMTVPVRVASAASLVMILVGIYATWIEPFRLQIETATVDVPPAREGQRSVRIAVMTDLQTSRVTDYERTAVERLMAQKPDVILIPGDVFQGNREQFDATSPDLKALLERLSAPGGVYLVLGDTDGGGEHLRYLIGSSEVRLLVNEIAQTTVGDRTLTIGGVALKTTTPEAQKVVERLETETGDGDIRILLTHRPDVALSLRERSRIDLVVAGHTHGGQIVIPGFGPPLTLTQVPRVVAAGGLHTLGSNAIYVSRGVGCERGQAPRIRFLCPPEVSVLEVGARPVYVQEARAN